MSGYKTNRSHGNTKVEVLDEGYAIKRRKKKRRPDRSHKDDEKTRRTEIAGQFDILRSFMPPSKKTKTRQEVLGVTRELIWEMKRNEEILDLSRRNGIQRKISDLERLLVMKRNEMNTLQRIKHKASNTTMPEHITISEEEIEDNLNIDETSMMIGDEPVPAHILIDHEMTVNEGIMLEEVLPPELYYQLANDELNKLECLGGEEDGNEEEEVVKGMISFETVDNKDSENEEEAENNKDQNNQNQPEYILGIPNPPRIYSEDGNTYSKIQIPLQSPMLFYNPGILPFHLYPPPAPIQDFPGLLFPPNPAYNIPQQPYHDTGPAHSLLDQLLTAASDADLTNNNVDVVN